MKARRLSTKEAATVAQPRRCANADVRRLPSTRMTRAPKAGSATISQSRSRTPPPETGCTTGMSCDASARGTAADMVRDIKVCLSVLQQARVVDRGRATGAEDGHDDRQPDDDLGGGDDHHEERRHLPLEVAVDAREGHQAQVRRVEHQLDTHEHDKG